MVRTLTEEEAMAAEATGAAEAPGPAQTFAGASASVREEIGGIFASLRRVATLEMSIWAARAKMAVVRIVMLVAMLALATVAALIGVIFLYAGIYRVLTDVLHVPAFWALLSFAGVHILGAIILVMAGLAMFKREDKGKKKGEGSK